MASSKWQKYQHMEGQVDKYTIHLSYSLSPQRLLPMEATVNVLIDAENGEWKADMVWDIFLEHEANSILSILLSTTLPGDKLVWIAAINERFSVKSAYHLARNRDTGGRGKALTRQP